MEGPCLKPYQVVQSHPSQRQEKKMTVIMERQHETHTCGLYKVIGSNKEIRCHGEKGSIEKGKENKDKRIKGWGIQYWWMTENRDQSHDGKKLQVFTRIKHRDWMILKRCSEMMKT
jgi:hypothetical protein